MIEGMTLRDWFAGQALQGFLASCGRGIDINKVPLFCSDMYEFADAMLAARSTVKAKPACTCPMDTEAGIREHAAGCPMAGTGERIRDILGLGGRYAGWTKYSDQPPTAEDALLGEVDWWLDWSNLGIFRAAWTCKPALLGLNLWWRKPV